MEKEEEEVKEIEGAKVEEVEGTRRCSPSQ